MIDKSLTLQIKNFAYSLGFNAVGICKAEAVNELNSAGYQSWLANSYQADMDYMARNVEKRLDPRLLVEGARSIIIVALNYYPHKFQPEENPQIAYYAYGKDYHDVVKSKLKLLYEYCQSLDSSVEGRYFCDTAPLLERYWAAKAGLGWVGKNSLLIIPKRGSFFFLGALVINAELEYEDVESMKIPNCGNCTRCIDACPTKAIVAPRVIDSNRCLSYQTIENRGKIDQQIVPLMNNRFYGCDLCQQACPWNRYSKSHSTEEFNPSDELLNLDEDKLTNLDEESYQRIFKGSAIKRAKLSGLKRNIEAWKRSKEQ